MNYNLTKKQKEFSRWIAKQITERLLDETFYCGWNWTTLNWSEGSDPTLRVLIFSPGRKSMKMDLDPGTVEALAAESLIRVVEVQDPPFPKELAFRLPDVTGLRCTITEKLLKAVESDFAEEKQQPLFSTLAQPHPPEIAMSLDRLRTKYPDASKLGFLVMRFEATKPFKRIVEVIKTTAEKHGLIIIRADENDFHSDLWGNVRTLLHGCGFGIAVYERIETNEPNANVGLEVGYLMAMNKPVLLLKDKTVPALQSDLAGKLYKPFDPHDPESSIPDQLTKWLEDNGVIVPRRV